jgi:hypothetical protein
VRRTRFDMVTLLGRALDAVCGTYLGTLDCLEFFGDKTLAACPRRSTSGSALESVCRTTFAIVPHQFAPPPHRPDGSFSRSALEAIGLPPPPPPSDGPRLCVIVRTYRDQVGTAYSDPNG